MVQYKVHILIALTIFVKLLHLSETTTLEQYYREAERELDEAKQLKWIVNKAKNVILMIGDGMSDATITTARIYKGQQKGGQNTGVEDWLSFDQFPFIGRSKTWTENAAVAASAGTGCAIMCGAKPEESTICVSPSIKRLDCANYDPNKHDLKSIFHYAADAGKRVGVVTNTRLTHATPANAYASVPNRGAESDTDLASRYSTTAEIGKCVDIATQLLNKANKFNVLMGGGRRNFLPKTATDPEYSTQTGRRSDNVNLVEKWKTQHQSKSAYVYNKVQFDAVNANDVDYLLGLFEPSHMKYEYQRRTTNDEPSLPEMVSKTIDILKKGDNGFFLLVEGGRIDQAHHAGQANSALLETTLFSDAVDIAVSKTNVNDTLIIVTADHGHSMVFNGYTARNVSVNGLNKPYFPEFQATDAKATTVLMYMDGPGAVPNATRNNPATQDVTKIDHVQQALIPTPDDEGASHSGEDVNIYARGPMAHLFHTTHEQHYIMHAIKFAACLDKYSNENHCKQTTTPPDMQYSAVIGIVVALAILIIVGIIVGIIVCVYTRKKNRPQQKGDKLQVIVQ